MDHNHWYSPGVWDDQSKCDELDRALSIHGRDEKWWRSINCCIEGIRPKCGVEGKTKIDSKKNNVRICKTRLIWPRIHPFATSCEYSNEHQVPLKWGDN
jgi:hypothetical protein